MGIGTLGFLAGASGQALEAIKSRQDDEREVRRARMLEELRRDTATYLADYQDRLTSAKVDDKQSGFDPTTNEYISRNNKGEEIGRRNDPSMAKEYADKQKAFDLQLDAARANIEQSKASAAASYASAERSRKGTALDQQTFDLAKGKGTGGMDEEEALRELMYQNKDAVSQARSAGVPQAKLNEVARLAVANAKTPAQAHQLFIDSLYYYTTPDANAARTKLKQTSLDKYGVATGASR